MTPPSIQPLTKRVNSAISEPSVLKRETDLIAIVKDIANRLKGPQTPPIPDRNELYVLAVFVRGLIDFFQLETTVFDPSWTEDKQALESVWTKLWDCRQRTRSFPGIVTGSIHARISNLLSQLDHFYDQNFGSGVYASSDILVKKSACSLCGLNIKLCTHIPGRLYDGQMCQQIMEDFELISFSMVTNPEDPRCRIWPWNYDSEKSTATGVFFTAFQTDDFLHDEEWAEKVVSQRPSLLAIASQPAKL